MNFSLPPYPLATDMWQELKKAEKPILMYGMGNGADKILAELDKREICVSDFFASDGFVRGHFFHSKKVLSYSEAKEKYKDFIVLLAFGSSLDDVISNIEKIADEQVLYAPDVPVSGTDIFDAEFYNSNYTEIKRAYDALADEDSKEVFAAVVNFKLTGDIRYLTSSPTDKDDILRYDRYKICVDAGAYRGESCRELFSKAPNIEKIYALEPDKKSFAKLVAYAEGEPRVTPLNCGAWSDSGEGMFNSQGNRNSSFSADGNVPTSLASVDDILANAAPDYLKYDVEGCEREALYGSKKVIGTYMPDLLVCVYHRSGDIFSLVNLINDNFSGYDIQLRKKKYVPAWDVYVLATKSE